MKSAEKIKNKVFVNMQVSSAIEAMKGWEQEHSKWLGTVESLMLESNKLCNNLIQFGTF